jgi:hypothetical protein
MLQQMALTLQQMIPTLQQTVPMLQMTPTLQQMALTPRQTVPTLQTVPMLQQMSPTLRQTVQTLQHAEYIRERIPNFSKAPSRSLRGRDRIMNLMQLFILNSGQNTNNESWSRGGPSESERVVNERSRKQHQAISDTSILPCILNTTSTFSRSQSLGCFPSLPLRWCESMMIYFCVNQSSV